MAELNREESKRTLHKIVTDLTSPIQKHYGFKPWIFSLLLIIGVGLYAYVTQLQKGLGATNLNDYVSWGLYIAGFIFFVATALIGMLISSVLGLIGVKWIHPIARIAEMIALGFALMAGLVIVFDMGRPDRAHHLFLYGRPQSPIVWDLTVVLTYTAISLLLYILPLIPDMPFLKKTIHNRPKWQQKVYNFLAFNWIGDREQYRILKRSIRVLSILIIPVALAIHTVTSWLFALTPRVGWDSTIFGPYYVTGAFVNGVAAVLIAMYIFRQNFKLKEYLTDFHFERVARLFVLMMLVYLYFNINEYIVPGYKMKKGEDVHLLTLFSGHYSGLFWYTQFTGLLLPIFLLLFKKMRKPVPTAIIGLFVIIAGLLKRFLITVPTLEHPHLPIQNVPESFHSYTPNGIEWAILGMSIGGALLIITILAKLFPVMPIWEIAHDKGVHEDDIKNYDPKEYESNKAIN